MNRQLRARIVLEEARALGIDLDDLIAAATGDHRPITVTAWIDQIAPTFSRSTARTYRPYWRLLVTMFGDRALAELTTMDLAVVVDAAGERAKTHRPDSTGRSSRESCVAALRAAWKRAVDAGHVTSDPAAALRKPRRSNSRRRALDDRELTDLADVIRATRRDPDLDLLLVRFHLETGARVQGALNLGQRDIDPARSTVWLHEKQDSVREQPASPSLVELLFAHVSERGGSGEDDAVFRTRRGIPVTDRFYDRLFARARQNLGWDHRTPLTAHVLRHTAITRVGLIAASRSPRPSPATRLRRSPADTSTPPSPTSRPPSPS